MTQSITINGTTFDYEQDPEHPFVACYMQYYSTCVAEHETASDAISSLCWMEDDGLCFSMAVVNAMTGDPVWTCEDRLSIWDAYDIRHQYDAIETTGEVRHTLP